MTYVVDPYCITRHLFTKFCLFNKSLVVLNRPKSESDQQTIRILYDFVNQAAVLHYVSIPYWPTPFFRLVQHTWTQFDMLPYIRMIDLNFPYNEKVSPTISWYIYIYNIYIYICGLSHRSSKIIGFAGMRSVFAFDFRKRQEDSEPWGFP